MLWKIRKAKIDTVIDLELFSRATSILSYLSGAKRRVGYYKFYNEGLYRGNFLTHNVQYNVHQHISVNFLNLVYALKAPIHEVPMLKKRADDKPTVPRIESSEEERRKMFEKLNGLNPNIKEGDKIVILNPNAGLLPIRAWALEKYVELTRKVVEDAFVVVMGVGDAANDAKVICEVSKDKCIDLTNKTTLKEVVDLFNVSDVLVTNDSGPAHFASLTPIKNIVFFGPETPKLYGPLGENSMPVYSDFSCSPCVAASNHRKTPCSDNKCLQVVTVGEVYKLVKESI